MQTDMRACVRVCDSFSFQNFSLLVSESSRGDKKKHVQRNDDGIIFSCAKVRPETLKRVGRGVLRQIFVSCVRLT